MNPDTRSKRIILSATTAQLLLWLSDRERTNAFREKVAQELQQRRTEGSGILL